jgi:uncharacterized SAM-binding protein YcdF (DUF218 family)
LLSVKHLRITSIATLLLIAIALYQASAQILALQSNVQPAGTIILLGGESGERVFRAAEVYHQGLATEIIVSGNGDCRKNHDRLRLAGVPESSIIDECLSKSTAQNAEFTSGILRKKGIKSAIIVTSWWHTRRAIKSFGHYAPEIEFFVVPAFNGEKPGPSIDQIVFLMVEYAKSTWYFCKFNI